MTLSDDPRASRPPRKTPGSTSHYRPPRVSVAADPDFATHRAYGVPAPRRADIEEAFRATRVNPTGELPGPLPIREASAASSRREGFRPTPPDAENAAWPHLQFLGQFLVDRDGIIRWTNVECAREGLAGLGKFPGDEELLAAVRGLLPREDRAKMGDAPLR